MERVWKVWKTMFSSALVGMFQKILKYSTHASLAVEVGDESQKKTTMTKNVTWKDSFKEPQPPLNY